MKDSVFVIALCFLYSENKNGTILDVLAKKQQHACEEGSVWKALCERLCVKGSVWKALCVHCYAVSGEFFLQNGKEHSWLQGVRSLSFKYEVERTLCVRRSWS